jgi:hypothetical protein
MNRYVRWFCPVVWLGIAANAAFAVPALVAPGWLLRTVGLAPSYDSVWLGDAALLLLFLSITYFPAGLDPVRYRTNAIVLVVARWAFALFWLWPVFFNNAPRAYLLFGLTDLAFGAVQGVLLWLVLKEEAKYTTPAVAPARVAPDLVGSSRHG